MSGLGRLAALVFAILAAPAAANYGFVARFDTFGGGMNSVAVSADGSAIFVDEESTSGSGGGIQRFTPDGTRAAAWTLSSGRPFGMAVESSGNLLLADGGAHHIQRFSPDGGDLGAFGSDGTGDGQMHTPEDVAVGPGGDIFVADNGNNRVLRFSAGGTYVSQIAGTAATGGDGFPHTTGVSVDAAGNVYVTDGGNGTVRKFDATGALVTTIGAGQLGQARGTGFDRDGNLLVADSSKHQIAIFKPDGTFAGAFGADDLESPADVAGAPDGSVYVADDGIDDVVKFAPDTTAPKLTLGGAARQSVRTGSVKVRVTSGEAATLTASGPKLASAKGSVAPGRSTTLALKISAAAIRAVKAGRKVTVTVTVRATDASGNVATARRKVTLTR